MDRRITFIQPIYEVGDSNEEKIIGWEVIDDNPTVWASKRENKGDEIPIADQLTYSQQTHYGIRWRSDLNVRLQVVDGSQKYSILSITEIEEGRKRFLNVVTAIIQNQFFT